FVVNFRHILYSAAVGRRFTRFPPVKKVLAFFLLTDPQFATAERRMVTHGSIAPAYYFAYGLSLYSVWMISNALGALFGALIEDPAAFGFDFILPLYFVSGTGVPNTPQFRGHHVGKRLRITFGLCERWQPLAHHRGRIGRPGARSRAQQTARGGASRRAV
ncbi:MAG: AzlC family ABC transporter permease, partial [Pseudomonadota bacterium]